MKYIINCEYCGKEFLTNRENKKYCNQYCSNKAKQKRQEEKKTNPKQTENELMQVNFNNEIVITTKMLAEVYECEEGNITWNFNNNKDKFEECKHYYIVEGKELKDLRMCFSHLQISPKARMLYLWTKRGASRHCKMLGTDKAWDMFDMLEENYFNPKVPQLSKEDMAWLKLKHSDCHEEAQLIINSVVQEMTVGFAKVLAKEIDGEGRRITLTQLAKSLEEETNIPVKTGDITNFLFYKGYLNKRFFQRIDSTGNLLYKYTTSLQITDEPNMERNAHQQPTNKFIDEFANKGLAFTKQPDIRGKVMWELTDRFETYFKQNFLKEFTYFLQNTEKGWR